MKAVNIALVSVIAVTASVLSGCGGGGGGSSAAQGSGSVPALYAPLVGDYTVTWTSPNSNATGTFDVDIYSGPAPVGPISQAPVLLLTSSGNLPPLTGLPGQFGSINDYAPVGPGNYQLNPGGTAIDEISFEGWVYLIEGDGESEGYITSSMLLYISPGPRITGTLTVPITNGSNPATEVFNITLKPQTIVI